ncbi:MAG: DEAD/DEAH box helicase family protein [Candidatus Goldbacteria bacterium]|nr:DEAD/DEAH box helicase family protein [Candidatus Goldiibacteriota bacterium]
MKLYLQNIIESIRFEDLPSQWINFNFIKFSERKNLFDYQQNALKNTIKALFKYYIDCQGNKSKFFDVYKNNYFSEDLDFKFNENKKYRIFYEFSNDYKIEDGKIAFYHFINRMSFWMATGSGKTLVIVKLLELLGNLMQNNLLFKKDILFLTYRDDLIEQFKNHINEFNSSNNFFFINLYNLKDYDRIKKENKIKYNNEIDVFYYRSDLISDEQKDKIINFRNYDNNGNWYILLDEAHKGDKEDSKRQLFYSILSRNGFLFNFSATFTDPLDFVTCVFNFNLEKFIQQGYGKHIYISKSSILPLGENNDYTEDQKQIIILKIFLLLACLKKIKNKLNSFYHHPLILTLVNSVNVEDSDLYLFFKEIEKIAKGNVHKKLLTIAKKEIMEDLKGKCEFEEENVNFTIAEIENIDYSDLLENVFNTKTNGKIEVLKIPGNKQEIIFKLTTSDKPFALIKIGDISEWIKNKLTGYEINEKYDNESVFRNINKDYSDINILMGSRAFYEGWDSNRPNLILYINIGKGVDARKFVLQSIGRGVRIEPIPDKRKRLQFLYNKKEISDDIYNKIKDIINPIETLFIYGTKAKNLEEVINTLKDEKQEEIIGDLFEINPDVKDKLLLIPVYKDSERILIDENYMIKFEINESDFNLLKNYYEYIGDKITLVKYDCQPKILKKFNESFLNKNDYFKIDSAVITIENPEIIIKNLIKHFSIKIKEFKEFKKLEEEIIHFKYIKLTQSQREKIVEKIKQVLNYREKDKKLQEVAEKIQKEPKKALEYTKEIEKITQDYTNECEVEYGNERVKLKYIPNHYYIPVVMTKDEKEIYIMHIIKNKSEISFINELEQYLNQNNNFFKQFDWWYFSKIDETLDEVFIPYYQPKTNKIEKFKPDFIFWLKKDNDYIILFIDPKGTEHVDGYRKIDGYKRIFEDENGCLKEFRFIDGKNKLKIKTILKLKTDEIAKVTDGYKKYWFDNFYSLISESNTI